MLEALTRDIYKTQSQMLALQWEDVLACDADFDIGRYPALARVVRAEAEDSSFSLTGEDDEAAKAEEPVKAEQPIKVAAGSTSAPAAATAGAAPAPATAEEIIAMLPPSHRDTFASILEVGFPPSRAYQVSPHILCGQLADRNPACRSGKTFVGLHTLISPQSIFTCTPEKRNIVVGHTVHVARLTSVNFRQRDRHIRSQYT